MTLACGMRSSPSGLCAWRRAWRELARRHPDRTRDANFVTDAISNECCDGNGSPQATNRPGDIEEGFIKGQRLNNRGDGSKDVHHLSRRLRVLIVVRRDKCCLRCQTSCREIGIAE